MTLAPEFDFINSVEYLYLRKLTEPRDNSLRIIVDEAMLNRSAPSPAPGEPPKLTGIFTDYIPIETTSNSKSFELSWEHYVAYLVTEECVGSCGVYEDEVYTGRIFRVYTKSHFLEHLARDTGTHTEPILHFKLTCLNHVIDIAAYTSPEIRVIDRGVSKSHPIQ
jgi:hypothetical protein